MKVEELLQLIATSPEDVSTEAHHFIGFIEKNLESVRFLAYLVRATIQDNPDTRQVSHFPGLLSRLNKGSEASP